jgi:hypothetical protein
MDENGKMRPIEAIRELGGRRRKEKDGGREFNYNKMYELLYMSQCIPSKTII